MVELYDKLLLFVICFTLYLSNTQSPYFIVSILVTITISCLCSYFDHLRYKLGLFLVFLGICQIIPALTLFLPLLLYDILGSTYQFMGILAIFPLFLNYHAFGLSMILFCILISFLGGFMKNKTENHKQLLIEFHTLRDNTKELSLLQEERNQSLLENQDYAINVATLNERNRISKEIHDNIGHLLSRSLLQIGALLTIAKDEETIENLSKLKESISSGMNSVRESIHNMHNESIDLYQALDDVTKNFTFCKISLQYDMKSYLELKLKYAFLGIVKEALANIMKHSNATEVTIQLREHPAIYQLIIQDNGTLNNIHNQTFLHLITNQSFEEGMGLQNIKDRVKSFHGNLNITIDNGFKLFITIPKNIQTANL